MASMLIKSIRDDLTALEHMVVINTLLRAHLIQSLLQRGHLGIQQRGQVARRHLGVIALIHGVQAAVGVLLQIRRSANYGTFLHKPAV